MEGSEPPIEARAEQHSAVADLSAQAPSIAAVVDDEVVLFHRGKPALLLVE
jgi:hypothetical protein